MKALLMATSNEHQATKQDIAELKVEFKDALYQQTRTYVSWMFELLTVYTAMAGSFVGIAAIIIRR
jgi:nucleoid-associated protein YejK